jgi:hypothetical protein
LGNNWATQIHEPFMNKDLMTNTKQIIKNGWTFFEVK